MITAHDRQTMMQITRAEIIAVTLLINLSDRSARFFEFWQSGCQPYARTDHNQPGSEAQILLQRSIA